MSIVDLDLDLGGIRALGDDGETQYLPGWYYDPVTGIYFYYDPTKNTFFTAQGGVYYPLGYMNPAPKVVNVAPGDQLRITLSFKYTGPAVTGVTGYYVLGVYGVGFTESFKGTTTFNIPRVTTVPTSPNVTNSYTFTIASDIGASCNDIYVKIFGGTPSLGSSVNPTYIFGYYDALNIVGITPSITEFKISDFVKV